MNLARIEHYFSLFLSLMEMRRGDEIPETRLTGDRPAVTAFSADRSLGLQIVPQAVANPRSQGLSSVSHRMIPDVAILLWEGERLASVLVFDPKYKRDGQKPVMGDIDKMHTYRDGIRDSDGKRVVTYAAIVYPGESVDYAGQVGAVSAVPGHASPSNAVRGKVAAALSQAASQR